MQVIVNIWHVDSCSVAPGRSWEGYIRFVTSSDCKTDASKGCGRDRNGRRLEDAQRYFTKRKLNWRNVYLNFTWHKSYAGKF